MEKRRRTLRLALAAGLIYAGGASPCVPALEGTRLESPRYVLAYKHDSLEVAKHFALEVAACAKAGSPPPESLKIDAHMPEHRHGMNYAPQVQLIAPGRWRAEGLMLHMPGRWEFVFEIAAAGKTDRVTNALVLGELLDFSKDELARILQHGPWPPPLKRDASNRVSGNREAIALGERLFFEPRLSGTGSVLCASCHVPYRAFQDGRARAFGLEDVDRNTPSVLNVRFNRWFGWDGAQDNLWAQSLRPLLDPREMKGSAAHVAGVVRKLFPQHYRSAFGRSPPPSDEELLVDVGKALAAYQETLVSARTPFDEFRDALERGDRAAAARYPAAAQRGVRVFLRSNCNVCHFGPGFTNGEFADIGVSFFVRNGAVDPGRHGGIRKLKENAYNLLGRFNDDSSGASATSTRHVAAQHRNFGEFRVPSLRSAASTAPYMHNGSLATLRDVVKYYSELDEERLHADGEKILRPLRLSEREIEDLVAFLESLSEKQE